MPRRRTRSDDEVLDAVGRVLLRLGPHAFTFADVAREAGLSPATLVQRFGTKRGMLVAFARRSADQASSPFDTVADPSGSPLARLRAALLQIARGFRDRGELANSLALLVEDARDHDLRDAARLQAERREALILRHLQEARASGEIDAQRLPALARLIHAAWNGALVQWALRGEVPIDTWLSDTLSPLLPAPRGARREAPPAAPPAGSPRAARRRPKP